MTYVPRHAKYDYDLAETVHVRSNGIAIDGVEFPYHTSIDGPYIEKIDEGWPISKLAILWVPLVVDTEVGGITFGDS